MIFTRPEANRIAAGRKTQHRFPRSRHAPAPLDTIPVSYREECPARPGRLIPFETCRIQILSVEPAELADVTDEDAEAEGFASRSQLLAAWGSPRRPIEVWVMRFRRDRLDRPRLLALRVVAGSQGDYTDNPARAMADEPEAVDADTLAFLTAEARSRDRQRGAEAQAGRHDLPLDSQVRAYEQLARLHHVDIRDELRAFRRWSDPVARERQLSKIREKVDRIAA